MKKIGLIAGGGQFPIIFSKAAGSAGFSVHALAHINQTDPDLESHVDSIKWIHLGQLKRLVAFFKSCRIKEAVMMGTIIKPNLFEEMRPDELAVSIISNMKHTHDDAILRALADLLEQEGILIRSSTFLLPEILAAEGCWTKREPSGAERADINLGWDLAKEIGGLDIGQCIVVAGGSVMAIEAIDGTDETIARGGRLGSGNAVVIKVSKPNQDLRFDIPAVGIDTVRVMHEAGATALAVEAGKVIVFEKEEMISFADDCGISIIAL